MKNIAQVVPAPPLWAHSETSSRKPEIDLDHEQTSLDEPQTYSLKQNSIQEHLDEEKEKSSVEIIH